MAEVTQFTLGVDAGCRDGVVGKVIRVVVDPVASAVTHIVVEPKHLQGMGRLVPLELVEGTSSDGVSLDCSLAEFQELDAAEETHFLPGGGYPGYLPSQVFALPYYGLGTGAMAPPLITDAVPLGEVAVRRGEYVHASDGEIGRVQGLVIDRSSHHVTHVLLQEGHLWGRKEVAIPITSVTGISDGIHLNITKQDVQDLPPVDVEDLSGLTGA